MNQLDISKMYDPVVHFPKRLDCMPVGSTFMSKMSIEVDDHIRWEYDQRIHKLQSYVLQEHLADDIYDGWTESKWPATTFQMFKSTNRKKWWMRWFVDRYPVKFRTDPQLVRIRVGRYLNYPEATLVIRGLGRSRRYETITDLRDL